MDILLTAGSLVLVALCLIEISSIQFDAFKKEMQLKVNQ